jgi:hypothetical protein
MNFAIGESTETPSDVWHRCGGRGWERQVIDDTLLKPEAGGAVGDIDGDGRLDILMKPYHHNSPRVDVWLDDPK